MMGESSVAACEYGLCTPSIACRGAVSQNAQAHRAADRRHMPERQGKASRRPKILPNL